MGHCGGGRLSANDQFRMGSNTKTMVATLVLQLVAEHKLSLTDSVAEWLPGVVPGGSAITIRMLLNHTSGLFNYVNDPAILKAFIGQDPRIWTNPTPRTYRVRGRGHSRQVPGYSSEDFTDDTGRRTVSVFATSIFGVAGPEAAQADQNLADAAVCVMLDKPVPGA